MPKSIPAIVNPKLLAWARENAGYSLAQASERAKVPAAKLHQWESGDKQPTLRQAEDLAKKYHCSFSLFTLPEPPKTTPLATEYRRLPGVKPGAESPELRAAIRDLIYRRQVALNLLEELAELPQDFSLETHLTEDTEAVAARIRASLNISLETQFNWSNDSQAWKSWRNAVENKGVLVLLCSGVDPDEVRGVSLFHNKLPVIGINNHEVAASRPFTLLHELVHILLHNGRDEQPALDENRSDDDWGMVERFGEAVAGSVLMPAKSILDEPSVMERRPNEAWTVKDIRRLATKYKVTPLAFATRLLVLKRMSPTGYRRWKSDWNEFLSQFPPKPSRGFATPAQKALNRYGNTFTTLVLEALTLERISPVDASNYLRLGYPHIEDLRLHFTLGKPLPTYSREAE